MFFKKTMVALSILAMMAFASACGQGDENGKMAVEVDPYAIVEVDTSDMTMDTIVYSEGSEYYGEIADGKANGYGTYNSPYGDTYVGYFKDDLKHGQGTFTWANGDVYAGEWKDNKWNGYGTLTKADGTVEKGVWQDFDLVEPAE